MQNEMHKLFVYGSLRVPSILQSVCGYSFSLKPSKKRPNILFGELAILSGHRRVSPDNVYHYAVPATGSKIEGFVLHDVTPEALAEIDKYEGKFYEKEMVTVNTATGTVWAIAYLASRKSMRQQFGDRFHVNLIHELWLRKRIENFFQTHTRKGEDSADADIERRARRELLGTIERDLVVSHLRKEAVSDYFLEHELDRPYPSVKNLLKQDSSRTYFENYIGLVVKQVLLNQFELKIQTRFRYDMERLKVSPRYYTRVISLVIALRMINSNSKVVDSVIARCIEEMPCDGTHDILDYVKYAVSASDNMFDTRVAMSLIELVRNNRQPGLVPMGAEMELSNLGTNTIDITGEGTDPVFDGFRYFEDFRLDTLTWKLGGYIDDHGKGKRMKNRRGFLELAPGRLSSIGELSKPATADPWLLNQLIREIAAFYPCRPHSLHLSFQVRRHQIGKQKVLPPGFVKCLLALGGGIDTGKKGKLWISRMAHNEIQQTLYGEEFIFARCSRRNFEMFFEDEDDLSRRQNPAMSPYVQQYKFIRLDERANYEPLIMALKGLQISFNPGEYLTTQQLSGSKRLRNNYEEIKIWALEPTSITRQTRGRFLAAVQQGLLTEKGRGPAHKLHYIDWAVSAIDVQLRLFNKQIEKQHQQT